MSHIDFAIEQLAQRAEALKAEEKECRRTIPLDLSMLHAYDKMYHGVIDHIARLREEKK